jgi:hypothetical protein
MINDLGLKSPAAADKWRRLKNKLPVLLALLPGTLWAFEKNPSSDFPQVVGLRIEELKEVVRLTLALSAPVEAVETRFASPGRFVVILPAGCDKSLQKRLEVAKGAVVEVVLDSFPKNPSRTQVTVVLNTPVPCRAEAKPQARQVVLEAPFPPSNPPMTPAPLTAAQELILDFAGAELRDVFQGLALQSGRNIVVGPGVQGQATLHLSHVTLEKALDILCKLHHLDYREQGGVFLVGTVEEIERVRAAERQKEPSTLEILQVRKANPVQVQGLLSKLFPQVDFQAQEGLSVLAAVGRPEDIAQARRLLEQLNEVPSTTIPPSSPEVARTVARRLQTLDPEEAQQLLSEVWPHLKVRTIPARRILIITGRSEDVDGAEKLVEQLDSISQSPVQDQPEPIH